MTIRRPSVISLLLWGAVAAGVVLSAQTRDGSSFRLVPSNKELLPCTDPTSGGGLAATTGSACLGTAGIYHKFDSGPTDWVLLDSGGSALTASSTDTFTNKTLNAESTGNVLTLPFTLTFVVALSQDSTGSLGLSMPAAALAPVPTVVNGTNTRFAVARFDDDGAERQVQGHFSLPADWTGAIDLRGKWRAADTSGSVVWQVATICVGDAETSDPSWNTAQAITDAAKGTTLQQNDFSQTSVTTTGCAAGEEFYFKFFRDSDHASDNLDASTSGEADLIALVWTVRRAL